MKKLSVYAHVCAAGICLLFSGEAAAQIAVESMHVENATLQIDGDLSDWTGKKAESNNVDFIVLGGREIISGVDGWQDDSDLSANVAFAHDDQALYFAAVVSDEVIVQTKNAFTSEDHLQLHFAFIKGRKNNLRPLKLGIFADPVDKKIEVRKLSGNKNKAGAVVREIKGAVGGSTHSYTVEVRIPWSSLPLGDAKRIGMRGAVFAIDNDSSEQEPEDTIISTAPFEALEDYTQLPMLGQSDVTRPLGKFWEDKALTARTGTHFYAAVDLVSGEGMEQVLVADKYLMAFGPEMKNEAGYSAVRLPIESVEQIVRLELFDATGDKKKDILVEFNVDRGVEQRRWISIYRINEEFELQKVFSAATKISSMMSKVENDLRFVKGPDSTVAVKVTPVRVTGIDKEMGDPIPELDGNPMVVPWDEPAIATYTYSDGQYNRR